MKMKENLLTRLNTYDQQFEKDVKEIDEKLTATIKNTGGNAKKAQAQYHPEKYNTLQQHYKRKKSNHITQTQKENKHLDNIIHNKITTTQLVYEMFDTYLEVNKKQQEKLAQKYAPLGELIKIENINVRKDIDQAFNINALANQTNKDIAQEPDYTGTKTYYPRIYKTTQTLQIAGTYSLIAGTIATLPAAMSWAYQAPEAMWLSGISIGMMTVGGIALYASDKIEDTKNTLQAQAMNKVVEEANSLDQHLHSHIPK